ncbi:methylated-DNA--[protein]-cysteine S-methyltransferase [Simiduia sp. 21SJ11W-1]|uniref:methylated-DNA--[protein]-cysteine S-methyltransferase n=1 Tax=Simiduia sp. 21SJ11W-1 TaxID=2909669 RepID=UPI00273A688D|nr:methylated-DNA--[protein]-cysteine S-methyltransferase [Simiduia sp. 21SJ11W-1]
MNNKHESGAVARQVMTTPIGDLWVSASALGVTEVAFDKAASNFAGIPDARVPEALHWASEACVQLAEYFAGRRQEFDLPLAARGTAFQQQVWAALTAVPLGATASYGDIAAGIGKPKAVRAVGAANGRNPIAIVVPCHRVIGANGTLTGYAGGLARKQWLLRHEGVALQGALEF